MSNQALNSTQVPSRLPGLARAAGPSQLSQAVEGVMLQSIFRNQPESPELIASEMEAERRNLEGDNPSPLERKLVERIIFCQTELLCLEGSYYQQQDLFTDRSRERFDRLITNAHNRYIQAIKALAQIRRLQLPSVQVNIGEKQVNVGSVSAQG